MYWLWFAFGRGSIVVCVASHSCVALCIGDVMRHASGVGMVSMVIKRNNHTAEGKCHVLPSALLR